MEIDNQLVPAVVFCGKLRLKWTKDLHRIMQHISETVVFSYNTSFGIFPQDAGCLQSSSCLIHHRVHPQGQGSKRFHLPCMRTTRRIFTWSLAPAEDSPSNSRSDQNREGPKSFLG